MTSASKSLEDLLTIYKDPSAERNVYTDLPTRTSTRVFQLIPAPHGGPIFAALTVIDLDDNDEPSYKALSYAWGSTETPETVICVTEHGWERIPITENLHTILCHLRAISDSISSSESFWIDALSINQSRDERGLAERARQVQMMDVVFSRAATVIVYLGNVSHHYEVFCTLILRFGEHLDAFHKEIIRTKRILETFSDMRSDPRLWDALTSLAKDPYKDRLWTYQEYVLANDLEFMINGVIWKERPIMNMMTGLVLFFAHQPVHDLRKLGVSLDHLSNVVDWCQKLRDKDDSRYEFRQNPEAFTVCGLFHRSLKAQTTDARDRLYALYGLAADRGWGVEGPIPIDYTMDVASLSTEVSKLFVRADQDKLLLFQLFCGAKSPLPSWRVSLNQTDCNRWIPDYSLLGGPTQECLFKACGSSNLEMQLTSKADVIEIRGSVIDQVNRTGPTIPDVKSIMTATPAEGDTMEILRETISRSTQEVEPWIYYAMSHLYPDQLFETKWRTLCCDLRQNGDFLQRADVEQAGWYLSFILNSESNAYDISKNEDAQQWSRISFSMNGGKKLAVMQSRRLGLFPPDTTAGDDIVVFMGVPVPFVVRRQPDDTYKLVGECYVHGIMDGESLDTNTCVPTMIPVS